jgi:sterol desaturase/sphingolipid hydroxylase (fatty acid hydroxylase superfamily)
MTSFDAVRETIVSFALLAAIFVPLERVFPLHRQRVARAQIGTDLLYFLGQYLVWALPVLFVLQAVHRNAQLLPLADVRTSFGTLPLAAQLVLGILISDACTYWAHRFSHANAFLWRFHRVHHTAPHLDWLAAHREHPFDNLYTRVVENLPLILLGFPLHLLAGFAAFRGLWALYIHSNVALRPGPLRFVLGSPRLHHWHHEPEIGGRVNFANLNPLMDLAFGTYHDPGRDPARYGTGETASGGIVCQLLAPLVPARIAERLARARVGEVPNPGRRARSRPAG